MRRAVAHLLHRLAHSIYNDDRQQWLVITDEYGLSRCRIEVSADDSHGIESEADELPDGWSAHCDDWSPIRRNEMHGERFTDV